MSRVLNRKLWRRLAVVSASVLVVFAAGKDLALSQASAINKALNAKTYEIVSTGEEAGDTEYFKSSFSTKDDLKKYCDQKGRQIEQEGLVLLKNDNHALPLTKGDKVSILGQGAAKTNYATSGSSSAAGVTYPSMKDVMTSSGLSVNPTAVDFYSSGNGSKYGRTSKNLIGIVNECPWTEYDDVTKSSLTQYGDAAIVVFARDSGEGADIAAAGSDGEDGTYLSISPEEEELLKQLTLLKSAGQIKKIVVLLNMAVPMETDFLFRSGIDVDSCLWIGNVGTNGLYGVGDVLVGDAVPSGRLDDTYLRDNLSSPAMAEWMANPSSKFTQKYSNYRDYSLNQTQAYYAVYSESIYVGYRYYETRYEDMVMKTAETGAFDYSSVVSYPFGYGLSYTDFAYSDFGVSEKGTGFDVSVKVTNTGSVYSGKEAVEIYLQKPYTAYDKENGIEKSAVELAGFTKTDSLAPGASQVVKINIPKEEFKTYDANKAKTYILDEGKYYLTVGKNSHEAVNNILSVKGYAVSDGMDKAGDSSLAALAFDQASLDAETYAVSQTTGKAITNELDFADINKYENRGDNKVTYLSRSNWVGTWPDKAVSLSVSGDEMAKDLSSHKELPQTEEKMPEYNSGNQYQLIALRSKEGSPIAYDNPLWDTLLDQMSEEDQSVLITSAGFSTSAIPSVGKPATKDNDGPTGLVGTQTSTVMPSLGIWASSFNKDLIKEVGNALAEDARYAGFQSLYAPGVNIHRVAFGGRLNEYFSEDGYLTGEACASFAQGVQEKGVIPTVKHYAFNEEETNRNGVGIWLSEQEAREIMLRPFEIALRPDMGNAHAIMTSFNRAGCIWTSASKALMEDLTRDEFGFDGYSLTDMASSNGSSYMTYDDGIMNGTDLFLSSGGGSKNLDDYKDNAAFAQRMREACHRVLYVVCNYSCAMNGASSTTRVVTITPWWQKLLNGIIIASSVLLLGEGVMMIFCCCRKKES
jgi:beta-glucosidase